MSISSKDLYRHLDNSSVSGVFLVSKINDTWNLYMEPFVIKGEFIKMEAKDRADVAQHYHYNFSNLYAFIITDLGKVMREFRKL